VKVLNYIKGKLDRFGEIWSYLILAIVLFPTLESVFLRSLLSKPTIWTAELTTLLFGIFFFIGGAYCEARQGHVVMDLFYGRLRGTWKIAVDTVSLIACLVFCGVMVYFGSKLAIEVTATMEKSESLWAPYLWPSRWAIPVGAFLLFCRTLISYTESISQSRQWIREGRKR